MRRIVHSGVSALAIVLIILLIAPMAEGLEVEGWPGYTWGRLAHDLRGKYGDSVNALVNQGIAWTTLPGDVTFETYVEGSFADRNMDINWFNSNGTAEGIRFTKDFVKFGYEASQLTYSVNGEYTELDQLFVTWYYDWYSYMKRRRGGEGWPFSALRGSSWGRIRDDLSNQEGVSVATFINQGIDWFTLPGNITFNTFVEYHLAYRTQNPKWFNAHGPAVGFEFRKSAFNLGMDWYWETLTEQQDSTYMYWRCYLQWFFDWDLKSGGGEERTRWDMRR
ncbi:MAG: hypothetical protein HZA04_04070 [Nitrospinae bacterium]|nr:hypothetical protein [Nitrospinota bacterium]